MNFETLLYQKKDQIVWIIFNRPEVYNAINQQLGEELLNALKTARKDDSIRCIVLTGNGEKAFCSGQDLKEVHGLSRSLGESVEKRYNPIARALYSMEKPLICRLNGVAAGAGASIALACDYIIASENASMVFAFINIGLVPDTGSSYILPRLVGYRKAYELLTTGRKVLANELLQLGMINEVVTPNQLDERVNAVAQLYAEKPPLALKYTKKMLIQAWNNNLEACLEYEKIYQELAGRSEDYKEGVSAFIEKRKPQFQGK